MRFGLVRPWWSEILQTARNFFINSHFVLSQWCVALKNASRVLSLAHTSGSQRHLIGEKLASAVCQRSGLILEISARWKAPQLEAIEYDLMKTGATFARLETDCWCTTDNQ